MINRQPSLNLHIFISPLLHNKLSFVEGKELNNLHFNKENVHLDLNKNHYIENNGNNIFGY